MRSILPIAPAYYPILGQKLLFFFLLLVLLHGRLSAQIAPDARQQMDELWPKLRDHKGATREVIGYALKAASMHIDPEQVSTLLAMMLGLQDRDPQSPTYGNFVWLMAEQGQKPGDLNSVEFTMENAILLWNFYHESLKPEDRAVLKDVIEIAVHGMQGQKVRPDYTNIFLLKTWNMIAIGEAFERNDLAEEGYRMLGEWVDYTHLHGIPEYLSPTYLGVDVDPLALIQKFAHQEKGRKLAQAGLEYLWVLARANWFSPAERLGGAHARNYDYLLGRGYFDRQAVDWGWMPSAHLLASEYYADLELTKWIPPDMSAYAAASAVPRFVWLRYGDKPEMHATQYVGEHVSMGVAGTCKGTEDQAFVINFAGGAQMPMASYVLDGRGDPYGTKPALLAFGHSKAHHLVPFITSDQAGPNVLFFSSFGPFIKVDPHEVPSTCLDSNLDLPLQASVWQSGTQVQAPNGSKTPLDGSKPIFIRYQDVAIGVQVIDATDGADHQIAPALCADGEKFHAQRITWVHTAEAPKSESHILLLATAAEKLDENGFEQFEKQFAKSNTSFHFQNDRLTAYAETVDHSKLSLDADVVAGKAASGRPEPGGILVVNGVEMGQPILAPSAGTR